MCKLAELFPDNAREFAGYGSFGPWTPALVVFFFGRNVFASAANGCAAWLVVVLNEESLNTRFVLTLDIVPITLLIVPVKLF